MFWRFFHSSRVQWQPSIVVSSLLLASRGEPFKPINFLRKTFVAKGCDFHGPCVKSGQSLIVWNNLSNINTTRTSYVKQGLKKVNIDIHPYNADRILLKDMSYINVLTMPSCWVKRLQFPSTKFHQALVTLYPDSTNTLVQRNLLQCSTNLTLLTFFLLTLSFLIQHTLLLQAGDTSRTIC